MVVIPEGRLLLEVWLVLESPKSLGNEGELLL